MPGQSFLRKAQVGQEGTPGTPVAATALWRGGQARRTYPSRVMHRDERVAILPRRIDDIYIPTQGAILTMAEGPISFGQSRYIFEGGIEKETSPTQDGAGSDYIYNYGFGVSSAQTLRTFTWEVGTNQKVREGEYMFVREFNLSGAEDEALMLSAVWEGRQWTDSSFTGSVNPPTVEDMLFNNCKFYLDAVGGTIGTTQISDLIVGFTFNVVTGAITRRTANGTLYFTSQRWNRPQITGNLIFIHDTALDTEIANAEAGTAKIMRMICEGSTVVTPGTTYSKLTLIWDMAITWEDIPDLSEANGLETIEMPFSAGYSITDTLFSDLIVVVESSALP